MTSDTERESSMVLARLCIVGPSIRRYGNSLNKDANSRHGLLAALSPTKVGDILTSGCYREGEEWSFAGFAEFASFAKFMWKCANHGRTRRACGE